jgi:hypothetical protein
VIEEFEEQQDPSTAEETAPAGDEELEALGEEGDDGPDVGELDEDPAHNPDNELKDIKGG